MEMSAEIHLNIGETAAATDGAVIKAYALGSCVAVCLYDPSTKTGAMAHVLLPDSGGQGEGLAAERRGRYADTAVAELLRLMKLKGADLGKTWAKIYGGAKMFGFGPQMINCDIGKLNSEAAAAQLAKHGVPLTEAQVGGGYARTVSFDTADGSVSVSCRE